MLNCLRTSRNFFLRNRFSFSPVFASKSCFAHTSSSTDEPVKYSTSKANKWKAAYTRSGEEEEDLSAWFQPYVVIASVAALLTYFAILREENDIDRMLETPLYDRIEGLEESHLRIVLAYNIDNGKETAEIRARLKELEAQRSASTKT